MQAAAWGAGGTAAVVLCLSLAARWYVSTEQTVYWWDYVQWWNFSATLLNDYRQSPTAAARSVVRSFSRDYTLIPAIPTAAWCGLFGQSRMAFVTGLAAIYGGMLIVSSCLTTLAATQTADRQQRAWAAAVAAIIALCWPLPFGVSMRGFVDCGASAIACFILWLFFSTPLSRLPLWRCISIGCLLALLFLFRRYWSFWIVAFGLFVVLDAAWEGWKSRGAGLQPLLRLLRRPLVIGGMAAATLLVFASPMVLRVLRTNYADVYAAYQFAGTAGWWDRVPQLVGGVIGVNGLVYTAAGLVSLGYLVVLPAYRRTGLALATLAVLPLVLFQQVQAPGLHHHLLWSTSLMLATAVAAVDGIARLQSTASRHAGRWAIAAVTGITLVAGSQWAAAIVPAAAPLRPWLLTGSGQLPLVRHDLAELDRLIEAIDSEAIARQGKVRIYCLASSATLNAGILAAYAPSRQKLFRASPMVAQTHDIDLRDGFPRPLITSNLLIVTDPVQVHQGTEHQQVIVVPNTQVLNGTGFGEAFQRLDWQFELAGGVKVYLYERVRPLTGRDLTALTEPLRQAYPDRPYVWTYRPPSRNR